MTIVICGLCFLTTITDNKRSRASGFGIIQDSGIENLFSHIFVTSHSVIISAYMSNLDVRWIQRFSNFERAYIRLEEAMNMSSLNELERNGLVQRFEFTLEIGWKVMKDFLEDQGFDFIASPKETFRQAQNAQYIDYAQELIDGLEIRNVLSHDYSGDKFQASEDKLRERVFPALKKLYHFFSTYSNTQNK